jgi:8-oxo-dGTP pyrophosphatase MutT (NUDIX family)
MASPFLRQVAALPYRIEGGSPDAPVRVLLVTSRRTRRWVVPKGNLVVGMARHRAADREAEEEAGVLGRSRPAAIGSYRYRKRRNDGTSLLARVELFPLAVTAELANWKERHQRERRWFTLAEAAEAVEEPELRALIRGFDARAWEEMTAARALDAGRSGVVPLLGWVARLLPRRMAPAPGARARPERAEPRHVADRVKKRT